MTSEGSGGVLVGNTLDTPSPLFCVSAEYKGLKSLCFDTHLQVFILKEIDFAEMAARGLRSG